MSCFVRPTDQNTQKVCCYVIRQRKAPNPQNLETGTKKKLHHSTRRIVSVLLPAPVSHNVGPEVTQTETLKLSDLLKQY